ncbi:MAG: TonB-dependent receptor plug domain-containing protein [Bacteroidales bacterium]|nr:TonB-dependent receptor plug domain-containing protein [Bacteroidales bacterium]
MFGTISDFQFNPIENVMVQSPHTENKVISTKDGKYQILLPANTEVQLYFKHIAFRDTIFTLLGEPQESIKLDIILAATGSQLQSVDISTTYNDGYTRVDPKLTFSMPSPTGGAESLIKMLPGVSSVNELSAQYNVRGGNYDENLIFVNDIQIYRPFLVRNGNQEGLSFVNLDLTQSVKFSAGGFPAQYGDKTSSVMDVEYKTPKQFGGSFMIGFLGTSAHIEGCVKNKPKTRDIFTYLVGVRYKTNSYLLKSMETKGDYKPNFFDAQMLLGWNISEKFEIGLLGNISINKYLFVPSDRETRFGTIEDLKSFKVYFDGQEVDKYENYLGGLTFTYRPNFKNQLKLILSSYYAKESETFDIQSQYWLSDIEADLGSEGKDISKEISVRAVGTNIDHARNYINFFVSAADFRGEHQLHKRNSIFWGVKVQNERIKDELNQWHMNDSAGYTLPYIPNPNPGDSVPFGDPSRQLTLGEFNYYDASHFLNTIRITGFIQDTWKIDNDIKPRFTLNAGVRFHYWSYNKEFNASPRLSLLYKPRWKHDWLFWLKTGVYYQTPFYREFRDIQGKLNPNIKSQFSYQVILASEYNFKIWNRPFKFTMEGYYKYLDNLISYYVDNIQIVYSGKNDAMGYATGFDARFSGELIEGLESWLSISIMNTMDKNKPYYNNNGELVKPTYKRRPTDQRFVLNLFFQDHIPGFRPLRVNLNFVYSTGLPLWNPERERVKKNTLQMKDYFRVDIGFSYIFLEQSRDRFRNKSKFIRAIKNAGIYFEVFNLLGTNNVSSYMWIKDINNQYWAIPNYLTPRLINLKFAIEF